MESEIIGCILQKVLGFLARLHDCILSFSFKPFLNYLAVICLAFAACVLAGLVLYTVLRCYKKKRAAAAEDPCLDNLQREPLATYIANEIEHNSNKKYRYAITGEWGAGKTWLINRVCQILQSKGFDIRIFKVSVRKDARHVIQDIADSIQDASLSFFPRWCVKIVRFVFRHFTFGLGGGVFSLSSTFNSPFEEYEQLAIWTRKIKKMVIILEDVDRFPPDEIAPLLLHYESISHLPNVTFILCYDADILEKALTAKHEVYKGGKFIQKMRDMEFPLAPVDQDTALAFLLTLTKEKISAELRGVLFELESLLPDNPREIERFFEYVVRMESAFRQLRDGRTLYEVITQQKGMGFIKSSLLEKIIKIRWPKIAPVLGEEKFFTDYVMLQQKGEEQAIRELLKKDDLEAEDACIKTIAESLKSFTFRLVAKFDANLQTQDIQLWDTCACLAIEPQTQEQLSAKFGEIRADDCHEYARIVLDLYSIELALAADSMLEAFHQERANRALRLLEAVQYFYARVLRDSPVSKETQDMYAKLLSAFRDFAHFKGNPLDKELREKEEAVLKAILKTIPEAYLMDYMQPVRDDGVTQSGKEMAEMLNRVYSSVKNDEVIKQKILEAMRTANIYRMLRSESFEQQIMLDPKSLLWNKESDIWNQEALDDDFMSNLQRLFWYLREYSKLSEFFENKEFAEKFWQFLTAKEWQYRSQAFLGEVIWELSKIHEKGKFSDPAWISNPQYEKYKQGQQNT